MTTIIESAEAKAGQEAVLAILREKFGNLPEGNAVLAGFGTIIGWHSNMSRLKKFADCAAQCSSPDDFFERISEATFGK